MKISTTIGFNVVTMIEPMISDVYHIEKNSESGKFYIYSDNGLNTMDILEFAELDKAISEVKRKIKNYFKDRCEDNPKGF